MIPKLNFLWTHFKLISTPQTSRAGSKNAENSNETFLFHAVKISSHDSDWKWPRDRSNSNVTNPQGFSHKRRANRIHYSQHGWIDERKPPCEIRSRVTEHEYVPENSRSRGLWATFDFLLRSFLFNYYDFRLCFSSSASTRAEKWIILNTIDNHAHPMGIKAEKVAEILIRIHAKVFVLSHGSLESTENYMLWDSSVCGRDFLWEEIIKECSTSHKFLVVNSIKTVQIRLKSQGLFALNFTAFWSSQADKICTIIIAKLNYILDRYSPQL